ncbi:MAG: YraN family protein [Brevinematia bacterium]
MQNPDKKKKGRYFEKLACEYLIKKGYSLLDQNFSTPYGELDLIFKDGDILVIVEVKGRKKSKAFDIKRSIGREKVKRILKTTEIYITKKKIEFREIRLDAVFIEKIGKDFEISHFVNWI